MGSATETASNDTFSRVRRLEVDKARLMGETAIASATILGLKAVVDALRAEIARLDPGSHLLRPDGSYTSGKPRVGSDAIFEGAFDRAVANLRLPGLPHEYRDRKAA